MSHAQLKTVCTCSCFHTATTENMFDYFNNYKIVNNVWTEEVAKS